MQDASVYVTGQNLFYITGYDGVSPEPAVSTVYGRGIDNGRYPTPRTLLFGLSVTLLKKTTIMKKNIQLYYSRMPGNIFYWLLGYGTC